MTVTPRRSLKACLAGALIAAAWAALPAQAPAAGPVHRRPDRRPAGLGRETPAAGAARHRVTVARGAWRRVTVVVSRKAYARLRRKRAALRLTVRTTTQSGTATDRRKLRRARAR
jgi:hypothetical protein